jgi:hypothetical protein
VTDALREQRDATLALLDRLIRRGRDVHERLARNAQSTHSRIASANTAGSAWDVEARIWQNDCAVAVNELSGGSKAHWLSRAFSDALLMRAPDGEALAAANQADIIGRILDVLAQAARSVADVDAASAGASAGPAPRRFDFVHDGRLRPILEQALVESGRALDECDFERALKTACGIIEAIVTDALRPARPEPVALRRAQGDPEHAERVEGRSRAGQESANSLADCSFEQRIAAAEQAGLIGRGCARLTAAARAYRDESFAAVVTERDARVAAQVLRVVMRDLDPGR